MMRFILSSCLLAILVLNCATNVQADTGDVLWTKCEDIQVSGITIRNVCMTLAQAENCELKVTVTIAGQTIISQNLDMEASPEVCGVYTYNGVTCNFCLQFADDGQQVCVTVIPVCSGIPFPPQPVDCFPSSVLDGVEECEANMCPKECSGHGDCLSGTCDCYDGYYGDDCASTVPYWENCARVSQLSSDICVKLFYDECNINMQIVMENEDYEIPLLSQSYPITEFNAIFGEDTCVAVPPCQVCVGWDNLELNSTYAGGCGSMYFNCAYTQTVSRPLGCFEDTDIVPSCFGTCPNLCTGRGNCNAGVCECADGWTGKDCSEVLCPNACSGHGECTEDGCKCVNGWETDDCSKESSSKGGLSTGGMVAITFASVAAVGAAGAGAWYVIKKRTSTTQFSRLDLMEEEDLAAAHELQD